MPSRRPSSGVGLAGHLHSSAAPPNVPYNGYAFLRRGLPTVTLGDLDPERLQEAGEVLSRVLLDLDARRRVG